VVSKSITDEEHIPYKSPPLLRLNRTQVLWPEFFVIKAIHRNQSVVQAGILLHIFDLAVLDACDSKNGTRAHIAAAKKASEGGSMSSSRCHRLEYNAPSRARPEAKEQTAIVDANGCKEPLIAEVLLAVDLLNERRHMK
jgi:hypothetical protein